MRSLMAIVLLVGAGCVPIARPAEVSPTPDAELGRATATPPSTPGAMRSWLPTGTRALVLALTDLPPGFGLAEERNDSWDIFDGYQYVDGWIAFYRRTTTAGIAFVSSQATWYGTAEAAHAEIVEGLTYTVTRQQWAVEIPLGQTIGDESFGLRYGADPSAGEASYAVVFRTANITHWVFIRGVTGTVDISMAIELAKKQLARVHV